MKPFIFCFYKGLILLQLRFRPTKHVLHISTTAKGLILEKTSFNIPAYASTPLFKPYFAQGLASGFIAQR